MNDEITNYPLSWPVSWGRTKYFDRKSSQFGKHSIISSARVMEVPSE